MKCPQCQTDNNDAAQFCGNCGAKLAKACPHCNTYNPPQYAFCGECGYDLRSTPITTVNTAVSAAEITEPPRVTGEAAFEVSESAQTVTIEDVPAVSTPMPETTEQIKVSRRISTGTLIREFSKFLGKTGCVEG